MFKSGSNFSSPDPDPDQVKMVPDSATLVEIKLVQSLFKCYNCIVSISHIVSRVSVLLFVNKSYTLDNATMYKK